MVIQSHLKDVFYFSPKQLKPINIFWAGFFIYELGFVINTTGHANTVIFRLVQFIGILMFLPTGIYLINFKIKNSYLRTLFFFYCIWLLTVVCRGIHFNYTALNEMLFGADYGVFIYFAPLLLVFPNNLSFYRKLFDVIVLFGILFTFYDALFIRELMDRSGDTQEFIEHFSKSLSLPCGFILLTYKYHSKKRIIFALGVMLVSLLFSIYKARRGLSSISLSILLSSYLLYLANTRRKPLVLYLSLLLVVTGAFYASSRTNASKNGLFSFISQRANEDTRAAVELLFYDDMKTQDWIAGKGINGEYFCPNIDENQLTNYRTLIETGYLQIILKGGIISLVLYLLIAIPAIILGIFYSKNVLAKASGIWIFISLMSLYPATVNTFSLAFLLVWISIGICYSKKIRRLSDNTIQEFLENPPDYTGTNES